MKRNRHLSGPQLCDAAIQHAGQLEHYLRFHCQLGDGRVEDIMNAVSVIRYASFVAGSWQQTPIAEKVVFPPHIAA